MPQSVTRSPILIVEDRDSLRAMPARTLESHGHAVVEARDEPEAVERMRTTGPVVVLSDLRLPRGDGFGVIRAAKEYDAEMPVIVMTAYGSIQDAVAAIKQGALDFLAKPVDPDHLLLLVDRAVAQRRLVAEYLFLKEELGARRGLPKIVGSAPSLKAVSLAVQRAAGSDVTVLLEGESGTGKELFARAVHALSPRSQGPLVAINCAAIPEGLLETELFGHERGAFTGAAGRKMGKFEVADGGTIFLDEIGDLPLPLQAKILRVLETRSFERLGGIATIRVDVRVVAATNRNLRTAVANRQFREDLFFRLSVFPITIPPLRERQEDILLLARHFVERFCREMNKPVMAIDDAADEKLRAYRWPGNVRQLANEMRRLAAMSEAGAVLMPEHLDPAITAGRRTVPVERGPLTPTEVVFRLDQPHAALIEHAERAQIRYALAQCAGNLESAARMLGLSRKGLYLKRQRLGLE